MNTHKHLILSGISRNPTKDPKFIRAYLKDLVALADMEIFMAPQAKYCDDPQNAGVTGTIVITTSHASVHVWDATGLVQADLYSCKDFDVDRVVEFIAERFELDGVRHQAIDRRHDRPEEPYEPDEDGYQEPVKAPMWKRLLGIV